MGQTAAVLAFVAADAPFLDPLLLHIGLPALGTGKGPSHVMHHPLLFHNGSLSVHGLQSGHFFLNLAMLSSSASYAFSLSTISCHVPVQRSWYWIFSGTSGQRSRCNVARSIAWAVCSTYATDLFLFLPL